jgi:hypothetical protein
VQATTGRNIRSKSHSRPVQRRDAALAATPLPDTLPAAILERLRTNNITSCEVWRALGAKRGRIFGITRRMRNVIDRAVAAALKGRA